MFVVVRIGGDTKWQNTKNLNYKVNAYLKSTYTLLYSILLYSYHMYDLLLYLHLMYGLLMVLLSEYLHVPYVLYIPSTSY